MANKEKSPFDPLSPDELRAAYELAKKKFAEEFDEAELVRQLTARDGIPFESIIAELEEYCRQGQKPKGP